MSKSKFIISVRSHSSEERQELLTKLLSEAIENEIDILSNPDTAPSSGWVLAEMDEVAKEKMENQYAGKLAIEPDSDLQY